MTTRDPGDRVTTGRWHRNGHRSCSNGRMPDEPDQPGSESLWDRLAALPEAERQPIDDDLLPPSARRRRPADPTVPMAAPPHLPPPASAPTPPPDATAVMPTSATRAPAPAQRPPTPRAVPAHEGEWEEPRAPRRERRPRRKRRRLVWWLVTLFIFLFLMIGVPLIAATWLWGRVDKVEVAGLAGGGSNYLVVGSDSRADLDEGLDSAGSLGLGVEGGRTDTIMILHVGSGGNRLLSIPRDLLVTLPNGGQDRINAAFALDGPSGLVQAINDNLGIRVEHYMEVDFSGFLDVVDAVGGIEIPFARGACDPKSGLDIRETGLVNLDAEEALAFVRSRNFTEFDPAAVGDLTCDEITANGLGVLDPTSDLGRVERQRQFLTELLASATSTLNPITGLRALSGLSGGLRVDSGMGIWDAVSLARQFRGSELASDTLGPTSGQTTSGGAAVLVLDQAAAAGQLALYRD